MRASLPLSDVSLVRSSIRKSERHVSSPNPQNGAEQNSKQSPKFYGPKTSEMYFRFLDGQLSFIKKPWDKAEE